MMYDGFDVDDLDALVADKISLGNRCAMLQARLEACVLALLIVSVACVIEAAALIFR